MKELLWVRFFPADWLSGTSGLSAAERGVYITLLALMYDAEGTIIRDEVRLARKCGLPTPAFRRVLDGLIAEAKIIDEGGALSNLRASDEIDNCHKMRAAKSKNASIGWQKRKGNQCPENASAMRSHTHIQLQLQDIGKPISTGRAARADRPPKQSSSDANDAAIDASFKEFWTIGPKRSRKEKAQSLYHRAVKRGEDPRAINEAWGRYAIDCGGRNAQHISCPANWLRDERWKDETNNVAFNSPILKTGRSNAEDMTANIAIAAQARSERLMIDPAYDTAEDVLDDAQ